jgi:hypothetical protein
MADDYTIRVDAGDLADIIADRQSARADLETFVRDAKEGAEQWRDELAELLSQFNGFRRAVQEATGLDQPELLHDDELIDRIRTAVRRPFSVFNIDRATVSDATPSLSPDALERVDALPEVSVEIKGVFAGAEFLYPWTAPGQAVPPVKQDVDPAWLDTAQQRVGEQLADDGPPTESMPPVEEPPAVDPAYVIGRVFVRTDTVPDDVLGLVTRMGDVWYHDLRVLDENQFWNEQADTWQSAANLLHMHGTVWELLNADQAEQPSVAEQALVDDEAARDE